MSNALNFGSYYAVWIMTILIASVGRPWLAALVPASWVLLQFKQSGWALREIRLALAALIVGLFADGTLAYMGLLSFDSAGLILAVPTWMTLLWVAFASTLRRSMRWILERPLLAMLLGAVGGPLAYIGGQSFGAVTLGEGTLSLAAVSVEYAFATPLLCRIAASEGTAAVSAPGVVLEAAR